MHTGSVGFTVELHPAEPPLDDSWEEAVEVSFTAASDQMGLYAFDSSYPFTLPTGAYRVRYCARGMQRGSDVDTLIGDEPVDFYWLQFWPGLDRILRQTSEAAAYWHHEGRDVPLVGVDQEIEDQLMAAARERGDRALSRAGRPRAR